jgi:hypothetical protein
VVGVVAADGTCRLDGLPEGMPLSLGRDGGDVVLSGEVTYCDW